VSDDHVTLPDDPSDQPTEVRPPVAPGGVAPQGAPEPVAPLCAECSAPLDEDQQYCLECGAPTPLAPALRRRLGPIAILAIGLGVLGIGAGTLAYALAKDDKSTAAVPTALTTAPSTFSSETFPTDPTASVDQTLSTDSGLPPFPSTSISPTDTLTSTTTPTDSTGVTPTIQPTTATTPSTFVPPPVTTPPASGADTWINGTSGWTVIIASTSSQSDATAFRNRVNSSGRSAGLIDSSQYSTLRPNLWVVFIGVYSSRTQAISQAASLRSTYPGAYAQHIVEG
jgi:hypothetical protein